ncbi:MAG: protein translocase subunit SecD [Ignavibacteriales bacterium]|nr:protein translocase subunit SecD [Ignavibacteriales bacterium]
MKKNRGKLIFIVASILLSLYFLYPTYKDYKFTKELRSLVGEDSLKYLEQNEGDIREARMKRIKLGLDLQGGMRVVLEVNVLKLLEDVAKNKDSLFEAILAETRSEALGSEQDVIDILKAKFEAKQARMSRYYGNIRDTDDDVVSRLRSESDNAIDRAMEIVRNRVDQYGVSEPSIQKQGGRRIIVELPGVSKEAEVRQLLQGTALLEFKLLTDLEITSKVYESIDKTLAGKPLIDSTEADTTTIAAKDTTKKDVAQADTSLFDSSLAQIPEDQLKAEEQARKEHPFFYLATTLPQQDQGWNGELYTAEENKAKVMRILDKPEIRRLIPSDMSFVWSAKHSFIAEGKKYYTLYAVKKNPELTGGVIVNARATIDPNYNQPIVTMEMNSEGARDWARITGANVDKRIAIIMDNACFSAPVVRTKIIGGNSQIEGMESVDEAKLLEIVLKAGALPAPVDIIQQTTVGPSLGEDSIRKGIFSSLLAFGLTIFFMIVYYRLGGTMADTALLLNLLFVLAVLAGFAGTLTLPGIAGIILTMAVAVDANVLIYERIREESVTGKTLAAAIDAGYSKAFTAIFDSNVTTFITGVILYQFGSGPIQGFALTLMIGIVASMFSAIVITRVIFNILTERGKVINFG